MNTKVEPRAEERICTLEKRMTTWLSVAFVQQVVLVGLLASAYFSWGDTGRLQALHAKVQTIEQGTRLDAHDTRLDALELGHIKHGARLEVLERGTAMHAHEARETIRQLSVAVADTQSQRPTNKPARTPGSQPRVHERQLQAAENEDRAVIRVDAPDGRAQFVMGARAAVDNVIMEKEHADEGGDFTLSRNLTRVLGIGVDGGVTVHTNPLNVASMVRSADGSPLHLQGHGGVNLQSKTSFTVQELDGQGRWSTQALKIYVGDSVEWTWTNYHNVIETDAAGSIKAGGVSSGVPMLTGTFTHTFEAAGTYRFKSQAQYTMTCTVEVLGEAFVLQNGTLTLGGDLEVGGNVRAAGFALEGTPALGFETEIKMFLANECPTGWTEATELGGYMLMGRAPGGQVNATKNRPMGASEDGRMHSTAWNHASDVRFVTTSGTHDLSVNDKYDSYGNGNRNRNLYYWDRMRSTTYQTPTYMAPIGEYYPFASVLLCKRV
mmetsp:Transcript_3046/g.6499  ORF Transcript_3046/g.6499 Transcript_3046/m.6499 type:complete len:493 (-) Transcript_3046:87-1565(-)